METSPLTAVLLSVHHNSQAARHEANAIAEDIAYSLIAGTPVDSKTVQNYLHELEGLLSTKRSSTESTDSYASTTSVDQHEAEMRDRMEYTGRSNPEVMNSVSSFMAEVKCYTRSTNPGVAETAISLIFNFI